jgi:hypothetical protein
MDRDQDPSPTRNQPRLLDEVHDVIRRQHYSIRTEQAYVDWIRNVVCTHADDVGRRRSPARILRSPTVIRRSPTMILCSPAVILRSPAMILRFRPCRQRIRPYRR